MKGLLIKDLKIILNQKKLFLVAVLFGAFFAYTNKDVTFAATYIVILMSMLALTTISYDDINGGMLFILSLPTTRTLYVVEKYIFTALNLVFSCVVSIVVCMLLGMLFGLDINTSTIISTTAGSTVGVGLMLAVNIPLELKFGVEKSRTAIFLSVAAIAVIVVGGYKLLTEVLHIDLKGMAMDVLSKLPSNQVALDAIIAAAFFLVLVIILAISYVFSYKIIMKKEY